MTHPYVTDPHSGAGNCLCGMIEASRAHPHAYARAYCDDLCVCAYPASHEIHTCARDAIPVDQPAGCRTTQHCAVHDFCHRCMPSLNEATRHLVKAIAAAGITTGTGRVYAELAATIRDAARQTTGQADAGPTCAHCKGTGADPEDEGDYDPCPECHGTGKDAPAVGQPAEAQATGRAAVLREAADTAEKLRQFEKVTGARQAAQVSENVGILRVATHLRHMAAESMPCSVPVACEDGGEPCERHEREQAHADGEHELCGAECPAVGQTAEAQATDEARPPREQWRVEIYDPLAEEWAPGVAFSERDIAAERLDAVDTYSPRWGTDTPPRRRLVRETTTWTVKDER